MGGEKPDQRSVSLGVSTRARKYCDPGGGEPTQPQMTQMQYVCIAAGSKSQETLYRTLLPGRGVYENPTDRRGGKGGGRAYGMPFDPVSSFKYLGRFL